MNNIRSSSWLSILAYTVGVAIGFFLILVGAWADMESGAYDFPRLANAGLGGLRCPVLMTREETGIISLSLSNPTDNPITPSVKVQISTDIFPQEITENVELMPGESRRLEWPVTSENIDLGWFVFAKVMRFSTYPLPSQETTCGIFVIDIPGTGRVFFPVLVTLSLIGMGWGLLQINRSLPASEWLRKHRGSLTFLALMIVLGLLLIVVGGWIFSLLVLVVILLLIIILSSSLVIDRSR